MSSAYSIEFPLLIQIPDILTPIRDLVTEDFPHGRPHIIVPRGQDDDIRRQLRACLIIQDDPRRRKPRDAAGGMLHFDLALDDQPATTDVDVVSASAREIQPRDAGVVDPFVDFEAGAFEAGEEGNVDGRDAFGEVDV